MPSDILWNHLALALEEEGDMVASWFKCPSLWIKRSGFESWPWTLHCVLGQDTLLSQFLCPPQVYKWVVVNLTLEVALRWTSITIQIFLVTSCYRNWDKLWPDVLDSQANFTPLPWGREIKLCWNLLVICLIENTKLPFLKCSFGRFPSPPTARL